MKHLRSTGVFSAVSLFSVVAMLVAGCNGGAPPNVEVEEANPSQAQAEDLSRNALTAAQAKTALKLIDDICADTWCSGDYNFGFRALTCNRAAETCTLTLQVFPREGVPSQAQSYWRSCKTFDFTGFGSLVETASNGYQSLADDYYDALTACTTRIVSHLR